MSQPYGRIFIVQSNLERTLSELIAIPSVTSNTIACHEILAYVRSTLASTDMFIRDNISIPNPWILATTQDTLEPDILLVTHLDVAPAEESMFKLRNQDGKLQGRGVYDMKFAAACYIELIKAHGNDLKKLNIGFLFTTDEESGGECMPGILDMGLKPKVAFIPDGGDDWKIEARAKGLYGVQLTAHGLTAHSSRPHEGDNAIHKLMDAIATLRKSYPNTEPSGATLSVNALKAGSGALTQLADQASATLDFRTFSENELTAFRSQVEELARTHNLDMHINYHGAPLLFDKDASVVQTFLHALQKQTGKDVEYMESYGATDGRYFAEHGIPCIITEPRGGNRHGPEEWLKTEDLGAYYELIERWLIQ